MILYHFPTSPFARRVRLVLAHKGLDAELRDARAETAHMAEVTRLHPLGTVPVLVDGQRVVCDSAAICRYVDHCKPSPAIFSEGLDGVLETELVALADRVITTLVDLALRYEPLTRDPGFEAVRAEHVKGKAQRALDRIAETATARAAPGTPLFGGRWSFADITCVTLSLWLEGLPARAVTFPLAKRMLDLGWTLPPALAAWAAPFRARPDVAGL
ncbi:MAG: glutathione S-transferase family protein [Deltaproteobacteria bacterium]|nr:glutathione S-transferase family protein [Deltaproteobacteria bacterium]